MAAPSTGFIRPPPEIRPIVEKTAQFVAKNGPEFEAKILDKEAGNVKFAFLAPSNPYHAYYKHCVELAKNPEAAAVAAAAKAAAAAVSESKKSEQQTGASADSTGTAAASASASAAAPASKPVTTASTVRRTVYLNPVARVMKSIDFAAPPPRDEYTVPQPPFVPLEDLELIRAAAQYTAANGTAFIDSIRESQVRQP
jgi:splicing factor 3A subunit 1